MRRTLSTILFALAYAVLLVPDIVHVPTLIGHYLEHQERTPDLGVVDFLALHYADQEHEQSGDSTHDQLPFRHQHQGDNLPSLLMVSNLTEVTAPPIEVQDRRVLIADDPLAGHRYGLIQPPRC